MFDFLNKKTSEDEKVIEKQPEQHAAPGTNIFHDPDLVDKLKGDHQTLLDVFGEIKVAFDSEDYPLVTEKLHLFKITLMDHLLTENVRLYIYLAHSFTNDESNHNLVQEFRSEMDQIAKVVMAFLTRYGTIGVDKDLAATFATDLEAVGGALVARIEREENTLYPLYLPNY